MEAQRTGSALSREREVNGAVLEKEGSGSKVKEGGLRRSGR